MYLLWEIIIGILAGFLAGQIVKGSGMGILIDLLVGIVGVDTGRVDFWFAGSGDVRPAGPAGDGHRGRDRAAADREGHQEINLQRKLWSAFRDHCGRRSSDTDA